MTTFMRSLFPSKRRKTDTITTTSLIVETTTTTSENGMIPTSSSTISLSNILHTSMPPPNGHRRQHSTGSYKNGLPPAVPRGPVAVRRKESNNNNTATSNLPLGHLCTQSHATLKTDDLRMLLVETENRVLFDTLTVIPTHGILVPGGNYSSCKEFRFLKRKRDTKMLGQMLFGAVPSATGSETFKIHILEDDDKILISKTFFIPKNLKDVNGSSDSDSQTTLKSLDGWQGRTLLTRSTTSTPEAFNRVRHISLNLCDEEGDVNCSTSTAGSSLTLPRAFSPPHRLSRTRRRQMAAKTSLSESTAYPIPSSLKARSRLSSIGSQTEDDQAGRHVALGLLIPADKRYFLFQHMPLIESEMSRFESRIMTSSCNPPTFLGNIYSAWKELAETICTLHNAPRLRNPVWLTLNERGSDDKIIAVQFCNQLAYLVRKYDTKDTGYFISNLVSAILMHHMSWVASVASPPVRNDARLRENLMKNSVLGMTPNEDAASLGYNAHMAQYLELSGNCGPHRSAKTVICGDDAELLSTICQVLSFFIRCSAIKHVDDEKCWQLPIEQAFSPINASETPDLAISPPSSVAFSPEKTFSDEEKPSIGRRGPNRKARFNNQGTSLSAGLVTSPSSSIDSLPSVVAHTAICVVETETTQSITIIDRLEYPCCGNSTDEEDETECDIWSPRPSSDGLGRSLFAGPLTTYCPHFVVSAILKNRVNMSDTISKMFDEVRCTDSPCHRSVAAASISSSQSSSSVCDVQLPENVLIIGDTNEWSVKILSSEGWDEVTSPSEAVVSMFEQFVDLHAAAPKNAEFLVSVIEDSLAHIVGKSLSLVEMVARDGPPTELTPDRVRTIVGCDHSDLRLIVNVAAVYWPPVLSSVFG